MVWMPGAVHKPIPASRTGMSRYDLVVIHTMVGSLAGTDGYFRRIAPGVNSHFGTGGYGEIWQWVDTAVRSGANLNGNHRSITIENADMGPGFASWNTNDASQVPAFTPQQIEANAKICAWAHRTHGVPLVMAPNSAPTSRGIAYHRQGCDPYRVTGGELWSSAYGKVCPGARRIAQIPQIIERARQIVSGSTVPPAPVPEEDQDMRIVVIPPSYTPYLLTSTGDYRQISGEYRDALRAAGVQQKTITEAQHRELWENRPGAIAPA